MVWDIAEEIGTLWVTEGHNEGCLLQRRDMIVILSELKFLLVVFLLRSILGVKFKVLLVLARKRNAMQTNLRHLTGRFFRDLTS